MPKRSETHMSQRRTQVLTAALRCFIRDGFHPTSMADVIAESGLSAGSVYRYFPSKHALICACAEDVFASVQPAVAELAERRTPASPGEAVEALLAAVVAAGEQRGLDLTRLVVLVWAESLRDDTLANLLNDYYLTIRRHLATVVRAWYDDGRGADVDVDSLTAVFLATIPGFLVQRLALREEAVSAGDFIHALGVLIESDSRS